MTIIMGLNITVLRQSFEYKKTMPFKGGMAYSFQCFKMFN